MKGRSRKFFLWRLRLSREGSSAWRAYGQICYVEVASQEAPGAGALVHQTIFCSGDAWSVARSADQVPGWQLGHGPRIPIEGWGM